MLSNMLQMLELIKGIVHPKIKIHNDCLNFGNMDFFLMEGQKPMMFHSKYFMQKM